MMSSGAALRALARSPALRRPAASSAQHAASITHVRCFSSLPSSAASSSTPLGRPTRAIPNSTAVRPFSSDDSEDDSASSDLSDLLSRELDEEDSTGSAEIPTELSELRTKIEAEWRIVDGGSALGGSEGGSSGTVKLFKKSAVGGGAKVGLVFHCQDTIVEDNSSAALDGEVNFGFGAVPEEGGEEEDDDSVAVRFTATVTKAGKAMVLSCVSENADATVGGVALVEGDAESAFKGIDESLYQGPEFSELPEDLQESFTVYLQEDLGIDGDVAAFIAMYADHREQTEYVSWLNGVQSIIK